MNTESTEEFDAGISPCINTDPRLPRQHTLDAHQLRALHRAIDTLAFTAEHYRGAQAQPRHTVEAVEALGRLASGISARENTRSDDYERVSRALTESKGLPRGVSELIDATVGAWEPIQAELIAQTTRFQRGE